MYCETDIPLPSHLFVVSHDLPGNKHAFTVSHPDQFIILQYSLHRVAAKSSPLGVSVKHSKQSIMHLTLGHIFLKQNGRVFLTCCQLGHTIKTDSSFDISLIQVIEMLLTMLANTWNLNPKSIVKRTSLSFNGVNKNSCLRLSFL